MARFGHLYVTRFDTEGHAVGFIVPYAFAVETRPWGERAANDEHFFGPLAA